MIPTQIGRLKSMLEARLRELSSSLRNRENIAIEKASDVVDNVELAGERDVAIWSLDKCFEQRRFVETALDRIAGGTYGCCLRCDEEISMKRLTALPYAFLCITCQEGAEHDESREQGVLKELAGIQIAS